MDFSNKIVLVSGGSSGIGAATAKLMAERNARVFVCSVAALVMKIFWKI